MKIDLHVHASERSRCSKVSEEEQIQTAIKKGLDALVFTDHNLLVPKGRIKELNSKYVPFRIFGGIEIRIHYGEIKHEDFLVIGIHDKKLECKVWNYKDLYTFVNDNNGYIAIAHPYRFKDEIIDMHGCIPHAVELRSSNIKDENHNKIIQLAKSWNCPLINNSDSHFVNTVGMYYNELFDIPRDETELVKFLKSGRYHMLKS